MKKYILSLINLILIVATASAQEQVITTNNDKTRVLTKKELRKQRVASRNFHYKAGTVLFQYDGSILITHTNKY